MDYLSNTTDSSDALPYSHFLDLFGTLQDDFNSILDSPSFTIPDLIYPFESDLLVEVDPPATAAEFISPPMSSATPRMATTVINNHDHSHHTSTRRTTKVHPCDQCDKVYPRRALAEGCQNRHQNRKPFHCTKRCGNSDWYTALLLLE
jgi:hypothetical protein